MCARVAGLGAPEHQSMLSCTYITPSTCSGLAPGRRALFGQLAKPGSTQRQLRVCVCGSRIWPQEESMSKRIPLTDLRQLSGTTCRLF
jgi:hypothetical protein